jgi:hypothetical protein
MARRCGRGTGRGSGADGGSGRRPCRKEPAPYLRLAAALLPELVAADALDDVGDEDLAATEALLRRLGHGQG